MPILAAEPDLYPGDLLDRVELGKEPEQQWWALYTMSRQEKQLMRRLRAMDIAFYTPMITRRSRMPGGRICVAQVPLFAGYVFMYGSGEARYRAMTSKCVSRYLSVVDGEELTHDLRQIRRLIESGAPLTPEQRLDSGMRVRIRSGPMSGLEGVIIRRQNQERLLVAVNFIKQGASVLLEDVQLERID
jgi:transcriptional antiterminator RfaH